MPADPSVVVYTPDPVKVEPGQEGFHNSDLEASRERVLNGASYRDCSTIALMPTPSDGKLHVKVADAMALLMVPMNQKFQRHRLEGMEVADAYNHGVQMVLDHPELSKYKFVLTVEHDNTPPPDGLMLLIESMYGGPWAGVSGLYWTKGEGGMPMIYGDPLDPVVNYRPQVPKIGEVQECRGIAMGFALWDMDLFRDKRLGPPWFRTVQQFIPYAGVSAGTQDLEWCGRAGALGYRFAVDTRVRVGHVQFEATAIHPAGFVW
jgi:hypothetical protein